MAMTQGTNGLGSNGLKGVGGGMAKAFEIPSKGGPKPKPHKGKKSDNDADDVKDPLAKIKK